jgi:acyl-CoA thioesterase FadM
VATTAKWKKPGLFLVVTKLECRFLAPARYDTILTTAKSVLACVDKTGRVQRMPDFTTESAE